MKTAAITGFPYALPEPSSYYRGIEAPNRPRADNLVTFLRTNRDSLQQKNFRNRSHHRYVLILVLETGGSVIVDGVEHPLRTGQAFLVKPFQFHHYLNLDSEQLRWLFFTFDLRLGNERVDLLSHSILEPHEDDLAIWQKIAFNSADRTSLEQKEALPLLDLLLFQLLQNYRQKAPRPAQDSWIAKVESRIVESVHQGWPIAEIARQLGLSERQLRTKFLQEMGITIRDYRANYQLNRAINLLRDSANNIGSIAERCGFNSQAVFNRFIKRETGKSPLALRRDL